MTSAVETYSRSGFIKTAVFAIVLTGVSGLVAVVSAPERVDCSSAGNVVNCELTRALGGRVPVKRVVLRDVRSATIAETEEVSGIGRPRREGDTSYRLRIVAADQIAFSVHSSESELHDLRTALERLRSPRGDAELHTKLTGTPWIHPWSVAALILGIALIPLWVLGYFFPALRPNRGRLAP